eukprot:Unigene5878_Nuclearia_a/m.17964 Unigene5878_Nuclearia_a/g.17964  ORF Unigene5878_Nuclearia_a/g.17964 Unigene5878_Nuclearia_a/m.17964 type:complete len:225 (-) Unigene5878_Nuclearia_a:7-681(-)
MAPPKYRGNHRGGNAGRQAARGTRGPPREARRGVDGGAAAGSEGDDDDEDKSGSDSGSGDEAGSSDEAGGSSSAAATAAGGAGGAAGAGAAVSADEPEADKDARKGVSALIEVENPNAPRKLPPGAKQELSRREREALEKERKQQEYWRLHAEGKTDQARADLARLAVIKKQREEAAAKKAAEKAEKDAAAAATAARIKAQKDAAEARVTELEKEEETKPKKKK